MLNKFHEKQQGMELIILEQLYRRSICCERSTGASTSQSSAGCARRCIAPTWADRRLSRRCCSVCCLVGISTGIRSERRLEEEINYNMAYKWFCGLHLTEKAPDAPTLSVNRKRRFRDKRHSRADLQ